MVSKRYVVKEGSESLHCCFEATVMDTTNDGPVCECLEEEDAKLICDALNAMDEGTDDEQITYKIA